ncbi:coil containing protein [Vibrio phage 1.211.B._10N.222.52.F11]|nr:coil containing protein [Vibrio phage 1.211.A._10N.222.52.F11]AUR95748.1 coil containing protein [Vibrio phage 1.211.B._10N.222.52.F11]
MSVVAAAVIGSAVVGGVSAYSSGKSQEKAAKQGMASEERIAAENRALQRELTDQQREDFAPWRDIGEQALNQMWEDVQSGKFLPDKFDPSQIDLKSDPGYEFRMDQGVEALDKSAAARGRLLSGAQQKALTDYGQNMGSQEYSNAYARYADQYAKESDRRAKEYNILSGLSGQGQASAAQQAGATGQLAQTEGNILSNLGRAQNVSAQNQGAARAGAYQGMAQAGNQAAQNWLMYKSLGAS